MLLDGLWMVHALLALSSFTLGNPVSNDPLAAPRVFISFKGRTLEPFPICLSILGLATGIVTSRIRHIPPVP